MKIEGMIHRASNVRSQVVNARFECPTCGTILSVPQIDKKFREPSLCKCGRRGQFKLISKELEDVQELTIKVQKKETVKSFITLNLQKKEFQRERGKIVGKRIKATCFLNNNGEMKIERIEYLDETQAKEDIDKEDMKKIRELAERHNLLKEISANIFSNVYGNEYLKEATILQLLGADKESGNIHILVNGDLGIGKTEIMNRLVNLFPENTLFSMARWAEKSITAKIIEGELLESLPLSREGVIYMDDIEKMSEGQKREIENVIENGEVNIIEKLRDVCTVRTNIALFAVCNKQELEYFKLKQLTEEFLTKFDLVFKIRDNVNKNQDEKIASKILDEKKENQNSISLDLIRNYISYAKQISTKLTKESNDEITKFYVEKRSGEKNFNEILINPRHIKSIKKLTVAYARARLSQEANKEDVKKAINLFESLEPIPQNTIDIEKILADAFSPMKILKQGGQMQS